MSFILDLYFEVPSAQSNNSSNPQFPAFQNTTPMKPTNLMRANYLPFFEKDADAKTTKPNY